jgi:methionyl-tRNA synthetase
MSKSVGKRRRPVRAGRRLWRRSAALFPAARGSVGQDGNYSHEAIVNRINADLANDFGNLAQRSLSMIGKQLGAWCRRRARFRRTTRRSSRPPTGMIGKAREAMKGFALPPGVERRLGGGGGPNAIFCRRSAVALAKTDPGGRDGVVCDGEVILRSRF